MSCLRASVGLLLLLTLAVPPLLPLFDLLRTPQAWDAWHEGPRILGLAGNTLALVLGVLLLTLPAGTALAVLLHRTDLPGRGWLRFLVLLALFVPLPLLVSGWRAVLDWAGAIPLDGLPAAIVLHGLAGLPWVVLLVGIGLERVERAHEEDALTMMPARAVLLRVTLPRIRLAIAATGLWLALQTAAEIGVTDLFQVRTFAEEVFTQLTRPDIQDVSFDLLTSRAVAVSLPSVLLTGLLMLLVVARWRNRLPPLDTITSPLVFHLGKPRAVLGGLAGSLVVGLIGVPVLGLIWKVWTLGYPLGSAIRSGPVVAEGLLMSGWVGGQTVLLALVACWLARESRWFGSVLAGLVILTWSLPGPIVGLGLKQAINWLMSLTESETVADVLYHGPSWVPVVWAQTIRLFPLTTALLWPAVRSLPRAAIESARLDGASALQEFLHIICPLTRRSTVLAGLVIAALSLGELSASKLVSTPGAQTFAEQLFIQLHYAVGGDLAARALFLLTGVCVVTGAVAIVRRWA